MKRRPDVSVILASPARAGEHMELDIVLSARAPIRVKAVDVRFHVLERAQQLASFLVDVGRRFGPMDLPAGTTQLRARLPLPADLVPPYVGPLGRVEHEVEVHVRIPWWINRRASFPVSVQTRDGEPAQPRGYTNRVGGPREGELGIELSLESDVVSPGGVLAGAVALTNVTNHRVRAVRLNLVSVESLLTSIGDGWPHDAVVLGYDLLKEAPEEGVSTRFQLSIPRTASATFRGKSLAHSWRLDVVAEIALGRDVKLSVPIRVRSTIAPAAETGPIRAPLVGRERFASVWSGVAAAAGLAFDPETERMRGAAGRVTIEIALAKGDETRLSAQLGYLPQGLALEAHSRTWTEALRLGEVSVGDGAFTDRIALRGRFDEQIVAVFDAPLRAALVPFDAVNLGDDGATLSALAGTSDADALTAFVANVLTASRALDGALGRIPPPPLMANLAAAWRAYAERVSARFEPGSMALHGIRARDERVDLATLWEGQTPVGTQITIALTPALERELDEIAQADLSAEALEAIVNVRGMVPSLRIGPAKIDVTFQAPIADPAPLEGLIDRIASLPRLLQTSPERGPYR